MHILIPGGSGFVGRNLIIYLVNKYPDYVVVNFDREKWELDKKQYFFVEGDVRNQELVSRTLKEYQINSLVNLVCDRTGPDIKQIESNICGQFILTQEALKSGLERFIYLSSDRVYAPRLGGAGQTATEDAAVAAHDFFSAHKIAAESLALAAYHTEKLPVVILRAVDCLGPWLKPERLISLLITNALQNNSLPIYHEGKRQRDWLHVSDLCAAIDKILHLKTISGEVLNLGWGVTHSILDTAKLILAHTEKPETLLKFIEEEPQPSFNPPALSSAKAEKLLGWKPQTNFSDALKDTVEWFKKQL